MGGAVSLDCWQGVVWVALAIAGQGVAWEGEGGKCEGEKAKKKYTKIDPNSRLYSIGHTLCLFSLNATRDPNRCAMPLWFILF